MCKIYKKETKRESKCVPAQSQLGTGKAVMEEVRGKKPGSIQKINKMAKISALISVITLNVSGLNSIKRHTVTECTKTKEKSVFNYVLRDARSI